VFSVDSHITKSFKDKEEEALKKVFAKTGVNVSDSFRLLAFWGLVIFCAPSAGQRQFWMTEITNAVQALKLSAQKKLDDTPNQGRKVINIGGNQDILFSSTPEN